MRGLFTSSLIGSETLSWDFVLSLKVWFYRVFEKNMFYLFLLMKITEKFRKKNISYIFSSYCHWFRRYVHNMDILLDLIPRRMLAMPVCIMIKKIIKGFSSLSFIKPYASISLNILLMANERLFPWIRQ